MRRFVSRPLRSGFVLAVLSVFAIVVIGSLGDSTAEVLLSLDQAHCLNNDQVASRTGGASGDTLRCTASANSPREAAIMFPGKRHIIKPSELEPGKAYELVTEMIFNCGDSYHCHAYGIVVPYVEGQQKQLRDVANNNAWNMYSLSNKRFTFTYNFIGGQQTFSMEVQLDGKVIYSQAGLSLPSWSDSLTFQARVSDSYSINSFVELRIVVSNLPVSERTWGADTAAATQITPNSGFSVTFDPQHSKWVLSSDTDLYFGGGSTAMGTMVVPPGVSSMFVGTANKGMSCSGKDVRVWAAPTMNSAGLLCQNTNNTLVFDGTEPPVTILTGRDKGGSTKVVFELVAVEPQEHACMPTIPTPLGRVAAPAAPQVGGVVVTVRVINGRMVVVVSNIVGTPEAGTVLVVLGNYTTRFIHVTSEDVLLQLVGVPASRDAAAAVVANASSVLADSIVVPGLNCTYTALLDVSKHCEGSWRLVKDAGSERDFVRGCAVRFASISDRNGFGDLSWNAAHTLYFNVTTTTSANCRPSDEEGAHIVCDEPVGSVQLQHYTALFGGFAVVVFAPVNPVVVRQLASVVCSEATATAKVIDCRRCFAAGGEKGSFFCHIHPEAKAGVSPVEFTITSVASSCANVTATTPSESCLQNSTVVTDVTVPERVAPQYAHYDGPRATISSECPNNGSALVVGPTDDIHMYITTTKRGTVRVVSLWIEWRVPEALQNHSQMKELVVPPRESVSTNSSCHPEAACTAEGALMLAGDTIAVTVSNPFAKDLDARQYLEFQLFSRVVIEAAAEVGDDKARAFEPQQQHAQEEINVGTYSLRSVAKEEEVISAAPLTSSASAIKLIFFLVSLMSLLLLC